MPNDAWNMHEIASRRAQWGCEKYLRHEITQVLGPMKEEWNRHLCQWMSLEEWNILLENKAWNEIKCLLYKQ